MRTLLIIGIGCGNPDHLTFEAVRALNRADVFIIPDKGTEKSALRAIRLAILDRFVANRSYRTVDVIMPTRGDDRADYRATVDEWHASIATRYVALIRTELAEGGTGALLVWGDPALYDSTIRIVETIRARGFPLDYDVIPGISSVQVLAARHSIPLNAIGQPVLITTGRKLAKGWPAGAESVVVMLDGEQTFAHIDADLDIWWGAYLGLPNEILVAGRLAAVKDEIVELTRGGTSPARLDHGHLPASPTPRERHLKPASAYVSAQMDAPTRLRHRVRPATHKPSAASSSDLASYLLPVGRRPDFTVFALSRRSLFVSSLPERTRGWSHARLRHDRHW